jgi:Tfp pilus assembly protein PilO
VIAERVDDMLRDVDPRTLMLAAVALLLIGILAGALYGIKPAWLELSQLRGQHERALESYSMGGAEGSAAAISVLESEVETLQEELYGGAAGVPRSEIESFVVDSLDRISGRHGVELLGITPDEPTSMWMFEELPYTVEVEGSYFSIHRWLYDVEEELRPMVVKQFQLSPGRSGEGVVLDLRLVAYRASEEAGA